MVEGSGFQNRRQVRSVRGFESLLFRSFGAKERTLAVVPTFLYLFIISRLFEGLQYDPEYSKAY